MTKLFKIRTYATVTYEYWVKANTQEQAEEKHNQGLSKPSNSGMPVDVYDETIDKITKYE